jgi:hypothetical protein
MNPRLALNAPHDPGKKRVGNIRYEHANGLGSTDLQTARHVVGVIVQRLHGGGDALGEFGADRIHAIDYFRDRPQRNVCQLRNIPNGGQNKTSLEISLMKQKQRLNQRLLYQIKRVISSQK